MTQQLESYLKMSTRKRPGGYDTKTAHSMRSFLSSLLRYSPNVTLQSFMDWLNQSSYKPGTKATVAKMLGRFLYVYNHLSKDEFEILKRGYTQPQTVWSSKQLTKRQLQMLIVKAASQTTNLAARRDPLMLAIMATAGLRIGQVCALDLSGVSIDSEYINMRIIVQKDNRKVDTKPYTFKQIPLSMSVGGFVFSELLQHYHELRVSSTTNNPAYFLNHSGQRVGENNMRMAMRKWGVPFTPHTLRHHAGTTFAAAHGLHKTAILLGHTNIQTTMRYVSPASVHVGELLKQLPEETQHEGTA